MRAYGEKEQMSKSLLFSSERRVRFDPDQEASLEIGELVQVDEERVNLILGEDVVHLQLSLVILFERRRRYGSVAVEIV